MHPGTLIRFVPFRTGHFIDPSETDARFARMAAESLAKQRQIETADSMPFEAFRRQYLAQDLLSGIRLAS